MAVDKKRRSEIEHLHDRARRLAVRDLIELHPTVYRMLYDSRVDELKKEVGFVDKRFRQNGSGGRAKPHGPEVSVEVPVPEEVVPLRALDGDKGGSPPRPADTPLPDHGQDYTRMERHHASG